MASVVRTPSPDDSASIEAEHRAMTTLLRLMGGCESLEDLAGEAVTYMRGWSGCEAVGLRLHAGEDYPYFETRGFPRPFVLLESHLCAKTIEGATLHDSLGRPVLECMCGNILQGRTDPNQPFFTKAGSFWSNGTSKLLASTTDEDRGAHTRNRCNAAGYESVALVPIRRGTEVMGLLQFNDHRGERFTQELICVFERFGECVGIAIGEKLAQRDLKAAVDQSEWLVRDAYHRVKNNLMVVESLLQLQADEIADQSDLAGFKDAMGRVRAMLLIHESLYRSKSLTSVSAASYVEKLGESLIEAYRSPAVDVGIAYSVDEMDLSPELALSCGLIINELISNALKHAFADRRVGKVQVSFKRAEGNLVLAVADDGIGAPEGLDLENAKSLGLLIVMTKARQLGGNLEVIRGNGTRFEIRFPAPAEVTPAG